jgi:hypothetical protein
MAGVLTAPTPDQAKRFADALDESWRVLARVDPEFAAVQRYYAIAIRSGETIAPLPRSAPTPPQGPSAKPPRLSKHKQAQIITAWFFDRREAFKGKVPPSEAQDVEDARKECPGVARATIRRHRPIEWKLGRGGKPVAEFVNGD